MIAGLGHTRIREFYEKWAAGTTSKKRTVAEDFEPTFGNPAKEASHEPHSIDPFCCARLDDRRTCGHCSPERVPGTRNSTSPTVAGRDPRAGIGGTARTHCTQRKGQVSDNARHDVSRVRSRCKE